MALNRVSKIDKRVKINNVLISVSNKAEIETLVAGLVEVNPGINIYSTGGTFTKIKEILGDKWSKNLRAVSDFTGQPEMQGGLVKTLDFKIYLGILSETYNEFHKEDLVRTEGVALDMVVVNLYPFKETIAKEGVTVEDARANIDIGGPCMLRASAKNYLRVVSLSNPTMYKDIVDELKQNQGYIGLESRFNCARNSFSHTADYDKAISEYLLKQDVAKVMSQYDFQDKLDD
ncbi:hypothetical protein EW093_16240 [Thiospirochaeta perfilievii]|uniref:MGS-like domain-containing protein n=1 Tax=Thiospirochaeta perfilievii TaxID=252967 RepID=A0A5C1QGB1_9SPIO|nr:hypothetical protein [Thiospirochaeta perfilievii]QEN06170.1 hypothetical protein EW093_16240 [Thiospirochaeta perfilievii]